MDCEEPLFGFSVVKMEPDRGSFDGLVCASILPSLKKHWREEIELAVDAVRFEAHRRRTRDQMDRWIRHLWYKAGAIRTKRCTGPTVTRD